MTEVKIGLETHVQLDTETKLFCGCPNKEADEPNTHVCETCLGHPGSKPRLNEEVVNQAVKASEALNCNVNEDVFFSRKTYFYPDMSKNYQITQYEIPVGESGEKEIKVGDEKKEIGITRIHIEEDPAKMKHVGGDISDSDYTKVDYNRAGTPLIEIVTDPDFTSPKEARAYLQQLAQMMQYLDLYQPESNFAIKTDANISIDGGERVEVKNITGTKDIEKALSYEISRQKQLKKRGREVTQQTRNFNQGTGATEEMREKETEEDYGYIFDPDLTRQELDEKLQEEIRESLPELPQEKFERFKEEYNLKDKLVESLITEASLAEDFEQLAGKFDADLVASWMTGDLKKVLNYNELTYSESGLEKDSIEYMLGLIDEEKISDRNAEMLLREVVGEKSDPEKVVEEEDLLKAEDDEIGEFVEAAIEENPEAVEDFESGEQEAVNFLVGQVMQKSQGKADPKTARAKILEQLE
ncbi:Asp-tRNA(Asn)/Glu-tRNA(Gln) amidotransferase subunit GatB [Candidatus Nanosalina sp. VS9-1]|uniref:Asp-tRNA(Asn)/Glu-tRNA(Gln) amidotransferase subunit GatB n=1 Tax=Candidatus Nanosalina sp. VS9-1 TaxID=3388566 RepID=UPI0039E1D431